MTLGSTDGSGRFRIGQPDQQRAQSSDQRHRRRGSSATQFSFTESSASVVRASGNGTLVDSNGDGVMDAMLDLGHAGKRDRLSVFHARQRLRQHSCRAGGSSRSASGSMWTHRFNSQIWVPLADTNGDGRGDSVVIDLDGNGIPDPQDDSSPGLAPQGVPTTNAVGLALLTLLLGAAGVWYLSQRQIDNVGTV